MEVLTPDRWLTRHEASARLGIGLRTLDWQRARGEHEPLVHFVRIGGRRRLLYSESEIERLIERRRVKDAEAREQRHAAFRRRTEQRLARRQARHAHHHSQSKGDSGAPLSGGPVSHRCRSRRGPAPETRRTGTRA